MHDSPESHPFAPAAPPRSAAESAREEWDETLDALAQAVAREIAAQGLLRKGAAKAIRFHFRGYARRLLVPILDETQGEIRRGMEESSRLTDENRRLRAGIAGLRQARRHEMRAVALGAALFASALTAALVLVIS
jgi:hypothetical protein